MGRLGTQGGVITVVAYAPYAKIPKQLLTNIPRLSLEIGG
jgi:hypothetical protein